MTAAARLTRNAQRWLPGLIRSRRNHPDWRGPIDVHVIVCDHFEPNVGSATLTVAGEQVRRWAEALPAIADRCRDSAGGSYRHNFFYPIETYEPALVDALAALCHRGLGNVEVQLHHDGSTATEMRDALETARHRLSERHGLLHRDEHGEIRYGFVHGNWALGNSRPDGRWCGVDHELAILAETGCYADFTNPSAPDSAQPMMVNAIYYATDGPNGRRGADRGQPATSGRACPPNHLLLVQGPLTLDWRQRKGGLLPRLDNAALHAGFMANPDRVRRWIDAAIHVGGRPDQRFVKLHTHGCKDGTLESLLAGGLDDLHAALEQVSGEREGTKFYWRTPWEAAQLIHELEAGPALMALT